MNQQLTRDELNKFFDMKGIDDMVHDTTLTAMIHIGKQTIPIMLNSINSTRMEELRRLRSPDTSIKVFESLMNYCFNLMVHKIARYAKEAVDYSKDVSTLEDIFERLKDDKLL